MNWNAHSQNAPLIIHTRTTWREEWKRRKIKLAQIKEQGTQCANNKARNALVREITGDQPHGG